MSQAEVEAEVEKKSRESSTHSRQMEAANKQRPSNITHNSGQDDADEPSKPHVISQDPVSNSQDEFVNVAEKEPEQKDPQPMNSHGKSEIKDDESPSKPNMPKASEKKANKNKPTKTQKFNQPYLEGSKFNKSARSGAASKKKGKMNKSKAAQSNAFHNQNSGRQDGEMSTRKVKYFI